MMPFRYPFNITRFSLPCSHLNFIDHTNLLAKTMAKGGGCMRLMSLCKYCGF